MRRGLVFVLVFSLLVFIPVMGVRVALSLYALDLGAGAFEVGVIGAASQIPMLFFSIPVAALLERCGPRITLATSALCGIAGTLLPWVWPDVTALVIASFLFGTSNVFAFQPSQTLVGLLGKPETLARDFSVYAFLSSLSALFGPYASGLAIDAAGHRNGFLVFLAFELVALAMVLVAGRVLPAATGTRTRTGGLAETLREPRVWRLIAISSLSCVGLDLFPFFVPLYGHAAGLSASAIGATVSVAAIGMILLPVLLPFLARVLGEERVMGACLGAMGLAFLMLLAPGNVPLLVTASFVYGFACYAANPLTSTLAWAHLPGPVAARFLAVRNTGNAALRVVIAPVFGALTAGLGLAAAITASAAIMAASGLWVGARRRFAALPPGQARGG